MDPFFKSIEKKKRRFDLNGECQCFEQYKKNKDDENRFVTKISRITSSILHFSFFFKCDRKGSCADLPQYDGKGKIIGWNASNDCHGKICRHKCRCQYRFIHTYEEIQVYRQITHVWDGGADYYTGSNLEKYTKQQSITRRFTVNQSKINVIGRNASVLDAVKKFKQKYSA